MTDELTERVARVMCEADNTYQNAWPAYAELATAAIAAVREAEAYELDLPSNAVCKEVLRERKRQVGGEGFGRLHDDGHAAGMLCCAAACYAFNAFHDAHFRDDGTPVGWPFDARWWKPKGARRDLIRAAALIVAEIERLDRLLTPPEGTE